MQVNTPRETLDVTIGGVKTELFMSFGLLHEIIPQVRDLVNVGMIGIDSELRGGVLNSIFVERDPKGKKIGEVDIFHLKISTNDVQEIVLWVQEHLLDFFLGAIENATKAHGPHLDRLKAPTSMPSGNGSSG